MFKRVEKRRRKKEEEEELGLDEDMKEILGTQETDSEESASDSDDHSDDDSSDEGEGMEQNGVGGGDEEGGDEEGESADEDDGKEEEEEDPNVTVSQALKDPLYVVSVLPEVKACIICPGKLLKGAKMVQTHRESNARKLSSCSLGFM